VGIAVEKALLFRELTQRNRDLTALNDVAAAVSGTLNLEGIMDTALNRVLDMTGHGRARYGYSETTTMALR
jgi:GAF domain-containing protein